MASIVREIEDLIINGKLKGALDRLKTALFEKRSKFYSEVISLEARLTLIDNQYRQNLLIWDQYTTDRSKLVKGFLELLSECAPELSENCDQSPASDARSDHTATPVRFHSEILLGDPNIRDLSWMNAGLKVAQGVCRVCIVTSRGNDFGTGFLVGEDVIMTNNHVIKNDKIATDSCAEFGYQRDDKGGYRPSVRYPFDTSRFFSSEPEELDYTLIGLKNVTEYPPVSSLGQIGCEC